MKYLIVLIFACVVVSALAITITVNQDGTSQYSTIQSAINASAHGDTVLVYPGTYFENINYSGKNITLASLELTTGNPAYRDSTIIDGNNNGSCVRVEFTATNATIFGFTIQHGSGKTYQFSGVTMRAGGGIHVAFATNFSIRNCLIRNNTASNGGGISVSGGYVYIKGSIVTTNYASYGGGINVNGNSNLYFDSINRCSVYENYAGRGNDILCSDTNSIVNVYLDMFTVNPPTDYYLKYGKSSPTWFGNFGIIDIHRGFRTEVNHDLFISLTGDDANDGFSWTTPMKTIVKALHTIASDSLNPKTIHLAPGVYSSGNGQIFPLSMKAHVKLIGDSLSTPVLLNQRNEITINAPYANGMNISNLVIEHGRHSPLYTVYIYRSNNTSLRNITINPVIALLMSGLMVYQSKCDLDNISLNGLSSKDQSGLRFSQSYGSLRNVSLNNCQNTGNDDNVSCVANIDYDSLLVIDNMKITNCSVANSVSGILSISSYYSVNPYLIMSNSLLANNTTNGLAPFIIDNLDYNNTAQISNCTFANNSGANKTVAFYGNMNISNCIFDNNTQGEITFGYVYNHPNQMHIANNLIKNYPSSVYIHPSLPITFNEYNFSANPSFAGTDVSNPLSYRLNFDSPCIDAGTPDTTGLYLPAFDLAGNPRIYNGVIDIGCYEWDSTSNPESNSPVINAETSISAYPNPFVDNVNISYNIPQKGKVSLDIYNLKGQKVKSLEYREKAAGLHSIQWNGKDSKGNRCSVGIYFVKATLGDKIIVTRKISLIR